MSTNPVPIIGNSQNPILVGLARLAAAQGHETELLDQGNGEYVSVADLAAARIYDETPQVYLRVVSGFGDVDFATVESVEQADSETEIQKFDDGTDSNLEDMREVWQWDNADNPADDDRSFDECWEANDLTVEPGGLA